MRSLSEMPRARGGANALLLSLGLAAVLLPAAPAPADDAIVPAADEALAQFVRQNIAKLDKPVLAVMPFAQEDGAASMEGAVLTERVVTRLSENGDIEVVEREHLDKALAEQKLGVAGFVSAETAAQAGKLVGARGILAGTIVELGDVVEIHARLFSVETGQVVAAQKVRARRTIKTFISPLWDDMDRIKSKGKSFTARIWMEKDKARIGDTVRMRIQTDRDSYVTVFDFGTDGSITVLFPNRYEPANRLEAGRPYALPRGGDYEIRVRGPAGIERIKLFATTKDVPLFVRDYAQSPFRSLADDAPGNLRSLQLSIGALDDTDWAESSCEFLIENVLR